MQPQRPALDRPSQARDTQRMGLAARDLTVKQAKLAEAVAMGSAETVLEAGRMAGYSHASTTSESLAKPNVQREIARLKANKLNTAKSLRLRAQARASVTLDKIEDSESAMRVAVMAATVEEKIPEESDDRGPDSITRAIALTHKAFQAGYAQALRGRSCRLVAHLHPQPIVSSDNEVR